MSKNIRIRCPFCGFIDVIKWGRREGHQRYKCNNCGSTFTLRRKDVSKRNRFIWFKWWIQGKQTIESISAMSGYSIRQLKTWFYEYLEEAPSWSIKKAKEVHLLIDGTWFHNGVCLVVYRDDNAKATLFYRLTDAEHEWEIIKDLDAIKSMGIRIGSVTSDGGQDIVRAVKIACPAAVRQRCLAHIERECLSWLTQNPKTAAGITLRRIACKISYIKTRNDELYWKKCLWAWHDEYCDFIKEKSKSPTGGMTYTHDNVRKAFYHLWRALPDMFHFLDYPQIPKTTNALESFFGHLKDCMRNHRGLSIDHHKNFVKWYLNFRNEEDKNSH